MILCMISMLLGVLIFGSGQLFERLFLADTYETEPQPQTKEEEFPEDEDSKFLGQWKNLLDYDGTIQEE